MNIFEFLGLPANHRAINKTTQLVKHWDEVPESRRKKGFAIQTKKDGVCSLTLIHHGHASIWSRTGKRFTNTSNLVTRISRLELPDGVYMGEMCCSSVSLEVLSGAVNPNRVNPLKDELCLVPCLLEMHFFDLVTVDEFIAGRSFTPFVDRVNNLGVNHLIASAQGRSLISIIRYSTADSHEEIANELDHAITNGEEGIVIRDPDADWEAGHKGWRVMKMVRGVDYDLRCIGFEEGKGKYTGKVANLIFGWKDGKTIKCMLGKGYTHSMAASMFNDMDTPNSAVGKIFQVYALEESSKGKLRLPKVGELRHDKGEADV